MARKPTNVFFRNRETGWCSHATVEIDDIAEFKRKHGAVDSPVVERQSQLSQIIITASESLCSAINSRPRSSFRRPRMP